MLIKVKSKHDLNESDITDESVYKKRREFIKNSSIAAVSSLAPSLFFGLEAGASIDFSNVEKSLYSVNQKTTSYDDITTYNNFYELGKGKKDPKINANRLKISPWSITIDGECDKPGVYNLEDFVSPYQLEERIYPLRCVEAWSMVIPWVGFPLSKLLKRVSPLSSARFAAFQPI